jgi:ABC-type transport system involved in multi-copper enzyme maturation permease subunit
MNKTERAVQDGVKAFFVCTHIEIQKLARGGICWIVTGFLLFFPFYFFAVNRIDSVKAWLLTQNIVLSDSIISNDIESWFSLNSLILYVCCFEGFGIICAWLFGMEYEGKTAQHLMTLPSARSTVVFSKLTALAFFIFIISLVLFAVFCILGFAAPPPEGEAWSWQQAAAAFKQHITITVMEILCMPTFALLALLFRNSLLPVFLSIAVFISTNYLSAVRYFLEFFPLTIPRWYLEHDGNLEAASIFVFLLWAFLSTTASVLYWRCADNNK